jgi:hypothetical protein
MKWSPTLADGGKYRGEFKRGVSPSFILFPLSFKGEGDTGGEVKKQCS